jgi:drug/metabolite transporter (DMT)-like permease
MELHGILAGTLGGSSPLAALPDCDYGSGLIKAGARVMSVAQSDPGQSSDARRLHRLGLMAALAATLSWSVAGLFTKIVTVDAWTILYWRGCYGFICTLFVLAVQNPRGWLSDFERFGVAGWGYCFAAAIGSIFFITSVKLTSVAHNAVIYATLPFMAAALGLVLFGERVKLVTLAAALLALLGVAIMVSGGDGDSDVLGDVLAVGMTLSAAIMILINRRAEGIPMTSAVAVGTLLAAVLALPFASPASATPFDHLILFIFGITQAAIGMVLLAFAAKHLPPTETALVTALDAPLAPFWVWLVLGLAPAPVTLAGGGIVLAAVIVHIILEGRAGKRPRPRRRPRAGDDRLPRTGRVPAGAPAGAGGARARGARTAHDR